MKARILNRSSLDTSQGGLDISSLIDVCFLLLIYFIVATTIQGSEKDLNIKTPGGLGPAGDLKPMLIKVDRAGAIYIGAGKNAILTDSDLSVRGVPNLSAQLESLALGAQLSSSIPVVQLKVDEGAQQQRVMDVLNALSEHKLKHVTFTDAE